MALHQNLSVISKMILSRGVIYGRGVDESADFSDYYLNSPRFEKSEREIRSKKKERKQRVSDRKAEWSKKKR